MQAYLTDFHFLGFIYVFYAGFFLSWLYNVVFSFLGRLHIFYRLIVDLCLATITAFALFLAVLNSGVGVLRLYMIAGFLLGILLYTQGIRVIFKKIISNANVKRKSAKGGE